jgi:hypothetical protein
MDRKDRRKDGTEGNIRKEAGSQKLMTVEAFTAMTMKGM